MSSAPSRYRAMTVDDLARSLAAADSERARRRLVLEFVEEYRFEPAEHKQALLAERPGTTGDACYDAFLGALAEHLAYHDGLPVPEWTYDPERFLDTWWFPVDLPSVRADAIVHSPCAFRIRGVFIGTGALDRT